MRRTETLLLPMSPENARGVCVAEFSSEVWQLAEDGPDHLLAHEWPWRMNCQIRPATVSISIETATPRSSSVRLDASAPGFGPIVSRHLTNHLEALTEAISHRAAQKMHALPSNGSADR